jgi:hypothetical protein
MAGRASSRAPSVRGYALAFGAPSVRGSRSRPRGPRARHPQGGTTDVQSILMPKEQFPTKMAAATWLREHNRRSRPLEDSGKVRPGRYWRARQYDPRPGYRKRTIRFGESGIKAVIEVRGARRR